MGEEGQEDEEFRWWVANGGELRIMAECQCVLLDEIDLKTEGGSRIQRNRIKSDKSADLKVRSKGQRLYKVRRYTVCILASQEKKMRGL